MTDAIHARGLAQVVRLILMAAGSAVHADHRGAPRDPAGNPIRRTRGSA